jgi:hypothetical protein
MEYQQEAPNDMDVEREREYYGRQHDDTPPLCKYKYCNLNSETIYSKNLVFLLRTVEVFVTTGVNDTTVNRPPHLEPRSDRNFAKS